MTGQLSLFKSKRQRGVRAPPPKEYLIHCVMADFIKRWLNPNFRATHMPMGESREHVFSKLGKRYSPTGNRLKRMGVTPGWPDFLFVGPGLPVWLELKRPGIGRQSEEQVLIEAHLRACGHDYLIFSDVKLAVAALVERGILRSGVNVQ